MSSNERAPLVIEVVTELIGGGERVHHLVVDDRGATRHDGAAASSTVRFSVAEAVADAIARGEMSAQDAFMHGDLRVGGDLTALVDGYRAIAALAESSR